MIVQATDLQLYEDPIVFGPADTTGDCKSYLRWEDEEAVAFVKSQSLRHGRIEVNKMIRGWGRITKELLMLDAAFPPDFGSLEPACSYSVLVKRPIPIPNMFTQVCDTTYQMPMLAWELRFPKEVVTSFLDRKIKVPFLVSWLTGCPEWKAEENERRARGIIRKQLGVVIEDSVLLIRPEG